MLLPIFFGDISLADYRDSEVIIYFVITILIIALFAWIYFGTHYTIKNGYLYHRSGPFFGKMKISSIRNIKYHSGWYVPVLYRPATDTVGIIITYNKFDDIYFSPKNRNEFVADLLKINSKIEVVNLHK